MRLSFVLAVVAAFKLAVPVAGSDDIECPVNCENIDCCSGWECREKPLEVEPFFVSEQFSCNPVAHRRDHLGPIYVCHDDWNTTLVLERREEELSL
ncbi:hypothetical protein F4604DRAFT_1747832, partial [Suillus subluteus]